MNNFEQTETIEDSSDTGPFTEVIAELGVEGALMAGRLGRLSEEQAVELDQALNHNGRGPEILLKLERG